MPSEPATGQQLYHGDTLKPAGALKVVGLTILAIFAVQTGLYGGAGLSPLAAGAAAFAVVGAGVVAYARYRRYKPSHYGVQRARGVFFLAAAMIGVSLWYLTSWLVVLIDPPGSTKGIEAIVTQTPLVPTLLVIAVMPAIVEEVVFRGIFTRALAKRFPALDSIALSATVFAVYHLLPAQMISTFVLGIAVGFLTLRAHSVLPAMLAHFLNNAMVIVISRNEVSSVSRWMENHPVTMVVASLAFVTGGIGLIATRPHE